MKNDVIKRRCEVRGRLVQLLLVCTTLCCVDQLKADRASCLQAANDTQASCLAQDRQARNQCDVAASTRQGTCLNQAYSDYQYCLATDPDYDVCDEEYGNAKDTCNMNYNGDEGSCMSAQQEGDDGCNSQYQSAINNCPPN